jgi:hypothetical protein
MSGNITALTTNSSITVLVDTVSGSGSATGWNFAVTGLAGPQGATGSNGQAGAFPASGEGYLAWSFDPAVVDGTSALSLATPSFQEIYLTAGTAINYVDFQAAVGYTGGTSYVAIYSATSSYVFGSLATVVVGYNSVATPFTVPSSGFYWIAIQTGASLYTSQASGFSGSYNPGYVPVANTLAGGRSVTVAGQSLNTNISGTPANAATLWFGLT